MQFTYKERIRLLELLREARSKQSTHVTSIDWRFKEPEPMSKDKEEYYLEEQSKAYAELDVLIGMIEKLKETI